MLILNALAFDPKTRHQSAVEFGDALARALTNEQETLEQHRKEVVEHPPTQLSVGPTPPEPQPELAKTLITPFEPLPFPSPVPLPSPVEPGPQRKRWPKLAGGLVLAVALAIGGYLLIAKRQSLFSGGANLKSQSGDPALARILVDRAKDA